MQLHEPSTMITDFFVTIQCVIQGALLFRARPSAGGPADGWPVRRVWIVVFLATGIAAGFGGVVHGFETIWPKATTDALWLGTVLGIGTGTSACGLARRVRSCPAGCTWWPWWRARRCSWLVGLDRDDPGPTSST